MTIVNGNPDQVEHTQPVERSNEIDHASSDASNSSEAKEVKIFREMSALPESVLAIISSAPDSERPDFSLLDSGSESHIISLIGGGLS